MISEQFGEIRPLHRQQTGKGRRAGQARLVRKDHLAHGQSGDHRLERTCVPSGKDRCPLPQTSVAVCAHLAACPHWCAHRCPETHLPRTSAGLKTLIPIRRLATCQPLAEQRTSPLAAVNGDHIPFASARAPPVEMIFLFFGYPTSYQLAPTTQGRPRPRAITAAWLVMPPRIGQDPPRRRAYREYLRGWFSRRTKHTILATARHMAWASSSGKDNLTGCGTRDLRQCPVTRVSRRAHLQAIDLTVQKFGHRARGGNAHHRLFTR